MHVNYSPLAMARKQAKYQRELVQMSDTRENNRSLWLVVLIGLALGLGLGLCIL